MKPLPPRKLVEFLRCYGRRAIIATSDVGGITKQYAGADDTIDVHNHDIMNEAADFIENMLKLTGWEKTDEDGCDE